MSKRAGNFIALDALVADIGPDATRLLSLMSSLDQAAAFDIEVVRSQSMENPVYYVQYAYARISSIRQSRSRTRHRAPADQRRGSESPRIRARDSSCSGAWRSSPTSSPRQHATGHRTR